MITFTHEERVADLPLVIRQSVKVWNDETITIDETVLTVPQLTRLTQLINKLGYV